MNKIEKNEFSERKLNPVVSLFKSILNRVFLVDIYAQRNDYEQVRQMLLVNSITLFAIVVLLIVGVLSYRQGIKVVGLLDQSAAVLLIFCIIYYRKSMNHRPPIYAGISIMTMLYYYLFFSGGAGNTGFLWYYTYPLFTLYLMGKKEGAIATLLLFIPAYIYLFVLWPDPAAKYPHDFTIRFIPSSLCVLFLGYLFESTRDKTYTKLRQKRMELEDSIAELRMKEDELLKAHQHLEHRVRERTKDLIREIEEKERSESIRKKLEEQLTRAEKLEMIGTLAGGVAHDLNNILSGLVGYPDLLLSDIQKDSPMRRPIEKIKESGLRAAAVVQDLLTLARRGVVVTEVVNLNAIVDKFIESAEFEKLKSFHQSVEFEVDLHPRLLNILGSSHHILKTIMNLVTNAAESIVNEGTVRIITKNQYVDRPISGYEEVDEGDYVLFSIIDNGTGIAAGDLKKIFEPFYTKKVMGMSGTGLGMSVVWSTMKDHQGYIDLKSTWGEGTACDLYFPVTRKELKAEKNNAPLHTYMGSEKILIVDDVQEQREIASQFLTRLGYRVSTAKSGEEAVAYLRSDTPDLLVLDMIMDPGIDGLDTYKQILELHPGQKAIIASGFSETERVRQAQRLGAGGYIKKPYILEEIGKAVRKELDKKQKDHILDRS